MAKKNIYLSLILCMLLVLPSCMENNNIKPTETIVAPSDTSVTRTVATDLTNTKLQGIKFNYEKNYLSLIDYVSNSEIKKIQLDKNSFIQENFKLKNGYAVKVSYSDEPVKIQEVSGIKIMSYPDKINKSFLRIYDDNLDLKKECNILDLMTREMFENLPYLAVSNDGNKVIWSYMQELYLYDFELNKKSKILDEKNNNVFFERVAFTEDCKNIIFMGSMADQEDELCYGLLELDSGKITSRSEKNYRCADLRISNNYICLNDSIDPRTDTSSGRVPVFNLKTKENFTMKVDGTESVMSLVTNDNKFLIAVKKNEDGGYRIRQYKLKTGEIINEESITIQDKETKLVDIISTNDTSKYYILIVGEDEKYICTEFTCREK